MGRLLIICLAAALVGGVLGALAGAALLSVAAPLPEHRPWFVGVCAALAAVAAALIAAIAHGGRANSGDGARGRLAAVLLGACAGALAARSLFGDHPAGKQLLCVALGGLAAACLMRLATRLRRRPPLEMDPGRRGRWFQFTLGSLLALTVIASAALALLVRGPMARRWVLSAIEASGGGRVHYASRAPEWIVQLLGDAARGFFDQVDRLELSDPTDADLRRLAMFTQLRTIQIQGDRVTDEGLKAVAQLASLETLSLDVGGVPPRSRRPAPLAVAGARITADGLAQLRRLPNLRDLSLSGAITDAMLKEISALAGLEKLWIAGWGSRPPAWPPITASGMAHLNKLTKLNELILAGLPIGDDEIAFVEPLTRLKRLELRQTDVTDAALRHLRSLDQLEWLGLMGTRITGTGFGDLRSLAQLRQIRLGKAPVTDDGLANLASFTNLTSLHLHGSKITDAGMPYLKSLVKLTLLDIANTAVSDEGLKSIEALPNMQDLYRGGTNTTSEGVQRLKQAWQRRRQRLGHSD